MPVATSLDLASEIALPDGLSVTWDRGIDMGTKVCVYGWIARSDGSRDFLVLDIDKEFGEVKRYTTSSAKWSATLNELYGPGTEHIPCVAYDTVLEKVWAWQ